MRRIFSTAAVLLTAALAVSACGGGGNPLASPAASAPATGSTGGGQVVVGSANFTGNVLLSSIYAQALKAKGVNVLQKPNVGSREVLYGLIKSGGLTVVPEYNGALLAYVDKENKATATADVNAALKAKLPPELEILDSSSAEDKDSLSVSQETATKYNLKSMEDLAKVSKDMVVGGFPEFQTRREQQFKDVYGLEFKEWKKTGETTADAIKDGTVQAGNVFTADPKLLINQLVALQDPKNVFSAQNITPLVNKAGANDTVKTTLNAVSAKLTTEQLVEMMKKVAIDKDDVSAVAKEWLTTNGLG